MTQLTDMPDAVDSAHQQKTLRRGSRARTTAAGSHAVEARSRLHALGITTVVAGILGAASAIVIIAWPDQVSDQHYSYPFDATSYAAAQLWFAVQHVGLLAGLYGLARLAWSRSSWLTRTGLALTLVGMLGLTVCELFAISAAHALVDTSRANAVDNSYGVPMVVIGLGMVIAGLGLARQPVLAGAGRWLPLTMGGYVFVVMFPAVFGPLVAGRIAIGVWMLMFAALGASLVRADSGRSR